LFQFLYKVLSQAPSRLAVTLVKCYRLLISPIFPNNCRFQPSCSKFAVDAFTQFGVFKGAWLSLKRIGRCHPWGEAGFDPVPSHIHNQADGKPLPQYLFEITKKNE